MKVTHVETLLLDNIEPYRGGRKWLFLRLFTDEGIVGLGERPTGHLTNLKSQIALLHDLCERFVVGQSPFDIENLWQRMYASNHDYRHPGLDSTPAISAIEMACWDIVGKAVNQPIYNLLGGKCHGRLRAYAYMPSEGIWENPEKAGEVAAQLVEEGNGNDLHNEIFVDPIEFRDGYIAPPQGPGLGVELDERVVERQRCRD